MPLNLLTTIEDLSQADLDTYIAELRHRRAIVQRVLQRGRATVAKPATTATLRLLLDKLNDKLETALKKADAALAKAETLANDVVATRLQLRDVTPQELAAEMEGEE